MIQLTINGNTLQTPAKTLADLIQQLELTGKRIAVEANGKLIPKHQHHTYMLANLDHIEIVHAVGGG